MMKTLFEIKLYFWKKKFSLSLLDFFSRMSEFVYFFEN
jgi:hypothetical protein